LQKLFCNVLQFAQKEAMTISRAESLNDRPLWIEAIADLAMTRLPQVQ
jgi:protoheme ferro-lyase